MRKLVLIAVLFCFGCYMNYSQRIVYYPESPDILISKMLEVFEEMGYMLDTDNRYPDAAMKALGYADPFIIGKKEQLKISATFKRKPQETAIEIHVSQIGKKISTKELDAIRDEAAQKFENKLKR